MNFIGFWRTTTTSGKKTLRFSEKETHKPYIKGYCYFQATIKNNDTDNAWSFACSSTIKYKSLSLILTCFIFPKF